MPKPIPRSILPPGAGIPYDIMETAENLNRNLALEKSDMFRPMPTGLEGIDMALGGGLHAGDLAILAGVQNVGKTAAVVQFATSFADSGALVIICCYEHTPIHLFERLMIQNSAAEDGGRGFSMDQLHEAYIATISEREQNGICDDVSYNSFNKLLGRIPNGVSSWSRMTKYQNSIWLVQGDGVVTTPQVLAAYVEMAKKYAVSRRIILIVDYLQRVPVITSTHHQTVDERVETVFHYLKSMALKAQDEGYVIPVLGVAAVEAEALRTGRVHMESVIGGAITAYEPDVAVTMNKDDRDIDGTPVVRWAIEKNRHGPSDLEWRHRFIGSAYSFVKKGQPVAEADSWQNERKKLRDELMGVHMANAVKEVFERGGGGKDGKNEC